MARRAPAPNLLPVWKRNTGAKLIAAPSQRIDPDQSSVSHWVATGKLSGQALTDEELAAVATALRKLIADDKFPLFAAPGAADHDPQIIRSNERSQDYT